jgi:hypothetical protein
MKLRVYLKKFSHSEAIMKRLYVLTSILFSLALNVHASEKPRSRAIFLEDADATTHYLRLEAPASLSLDLNFVLPDSVGTSGQALTTDGSGVLDWVSMLSNPMDSEGDLITGGTAGAAIKLDHPGVNDLVVRSTGSNSTGFGQIDSTGFFTTGAETSQSAPGVVKSAGQLIGTNTNDDAASGYVGEYLARTQATTAAFPTSTQYGDLGGGALSLSEGEWEVFGALTIFNNGSTHTETGFGISTTSGSSGGSLSYGLTFFPGTGTSSTSPLLTLYIPSIRIKVANGSTTNYYCKVYAVYSAGTPTYAGRCAARRVR